jgi:hypothetical protein
LDSRDLQKSAQKINQKNSNKSKNQSELLEQRISFLAYLAECETLELIDSDASRILEESLELVVEVTEGGRIHHRGMSPHRITGVLIRPSPFCRAFLSQLHEHVPFEEVRPQANR